LTSRNPHLYTHGGKRSHEPEFERRYGKNKGKRVYGAVVGKVKRERMAAGKCSVHGCGAPSVHHHGRHGCCGSTMHHTQITQSHFDGVEEHDGWSGPMRLAEVHGSNPRERGFEHITGNPFDFTNGPSVFMSPHPSIQHAAGHAREVSEMKHDPTLMGAQMFSQKYQEPRFTPGQRKRRKVAGGVTDMLSEWGL
jgi:hypothetical protein